MLRLEWTNKRNWLIALCTFLMASGLALLAFVVYITYFTGSYTSVSGDDSGTSTSAVHNIWLALMVVACLQVVAAIIGAIAADRIRLHLMTVFFWLVAILVGVVFLFAVIGLDFQYTFTIWLNHHWQDSSLSVAREFGCEAGTADTLCKVPIVGYPYSSQEAWCVANYGETNCAEIREAGLSRTSNAIGNWMTVAGVASLFSVLEMIAAMWLSVKLVTVPIIMRSMQRMVTYLMFLPGVASIAMGYFIHRAEVTFGADFLWLDVIYFVAGALLLACAAIGVVAGHLRYRKLLQVYIVGLFVVLACFIVLLATSFYVFATLKDDIRASDDESVALIACSLDLYGCCCCTEDPEGLYTVPSCPEWNRDEIAAIGQLLIKLTSLGLSICIVFVICGVITSLVLFHHLKGYQVEYV